MNSLQVMIFLFYHALFLKIAQLVIVSLFVLGLVAVVIKLWRWALKGG
jgi:hypothetical protein